MIDKFFKKIYENNNIEENTKENFEKTKLLYSLLGYNDNVDISYDGKGFSVSGIDIDKIFEEKSNYNLYRKDYKIFMKRISDNSIYIILE